MAETRRFVCIVCPRGCALDVEVVGAGADRSVAGVRGNSCPRGEDYGRCEVLDPRRSLTSTVRALGLAERRLPVRTAGEIPLDRLVEAARALDTITITRPVSCREVIVHDLIGLGVDLVATDDVTLPPTCPGKGAS